ncbi:MAG: hypothetical protein U1A06_08625 [Hoeflea sp.]|nr:hypothetical protein [Hoeflea sp.]
MIDPNSHIQASGEHPMDRVPDHFRYHAHARHLRRMAINAAVSALWQRLRTACAIDARRTDFWTG